MEQTQKEFIVAKFQERGDFGFLPVDKLSSMVEALLQLDEGYMLSAKVHDGEEYDDDAAYTVLFSGMQTRFPEYKMYMMRMCEDYLDYNEEYLETTDQIEWD